MPTTPPASPPRPPPRAPRSPPGARVPLAEKLAIVQRFRAGVVAELDALATTLTLEMGKPISQARNELNGLLPRIDFFLEQTEASIRDEHVFDGGGMHEQITHIPLGVVANISAWNYPWFVGCNVIVPALLTGNAVLYKPSEHATLTGLHITRLLHAAGVPADGDAVPGGRRRGGRARCWQQRLDGVFFTGSHATGVRIAQAVAPKLLKLQLELGGKDPSLRARRRRPAGRRRKPGRRRDVQHRPELLLGGTHLRAREPARRLRRALRRHRQGHAPWATRCSDDTYIGAITRAPQLAVLQAQVDDARGQGRHAALRRPQPARARATGSSPPC